MTIGVSVRRSCESRPRNAHADLPLSDRHVPISLGRDRLDGRTTAALVECISETKLDAAKRVRWPVVGLDSTL